MIRLLLVLLVAPLPALATGPQLYLVDTPAVLRGAPSGGAAEVGRLDPDGPPLAMLERDASGAWFHVEGQGAAGWVQADGLSPAFRRGPEAFRVTGVAPGDVLNVRAAPSASSRRLGDVGGSGSLVEVLEASPDARWGRVVHGEGNGWVSVRYLAPATVARIGDSAVPVGLACHGTEPFWSLRVAGPDRLVLEPAGEPPQAAAITGAMPAAGRAGFPAAVAAGTGERRLHLILRPSHCTDGMSDRHYGWSADLLTEDRFLTGCCHLTEEER